MESKTENIKSQMRKGFLEYCILLYLNQKPAYAYDIITMLQKGKFIIVEGTIYPLLTRLKNNGLLSYNWVESQSGPPRKYYSLTDEGVKMLNELEAAYSEINNIVNYLKTEIK